MIARIELADHDELDQQAGNGCRRKTAEHRQHKRSRALGHKRRAVSADHVKGAVRQIDDAHDAEDERQPGGQQEQRDPELNAVQNLLKRQHHGMEYSASS